MFKFNLPKELLAEYPAKNREDARLMVVDRATGKITHKKFKDIINYFDDGDVLILNDTKVFPARMYGNKEKTGAKIEVFLLRELNAESRLYYLVMTDALEDKPAELINPIDTLSRKQKWTADYSSGKMNLVSIRDGRRNNEIRFFIHFDKGGKCSGELKGEADMTGSNTAEYRQDGDPCKLKFIFSSGSVTLQEVEGCGSYRPQNCSFNGSYARKKESKPKSTGKNNK